MRSEINTYNYVNAKQKQMRNEKRGETENISLKREDLICFVGVPMPAGKKIEKPIVNARNLAVLCVTKTLMD